MKRKRFTEEQIIAALKEAERGLPVMEVSEARRLRQLEDENRQLKHLVADLTLDVQMLKAVNSKKW